MAVVMPAGVAEAKHASEAKRAMRQRRKDFIDLWNKIPIYVSLRAVETML
jgi:hypothetical protein